MIRSLLQQHFDSSVLFGTDSSLIKVLDGPECITPGSVIAIIKAKTNEHISTLLKLANEATTPFAIYPYSTGNNWGYGTKTPSVADKPIVLLDLSALNEITYFDKENGIVTLQPGVTQQRLYDFLDAQCADFMVPVTGAGPDCSVLANALERGYGITPIADHFSAVTAIKGFLPTGEFYESALAHMDGSRECYVDKTYKWKHGPYLEGLFTQSGNLVVTEMTLVLAPRPAGFDSFYMQFRAQESFTEAYATVKALFAELGGVVGSINLMDKRRVAAMVAPNPQGPGKHLNTTEEQLERIAKAYDVPQWTVIGTLYGTKAVTNAARREVKRIAKGRADRLIFSEGLLVTFGRWVTKHFPFSFLSKPREQLKKLAAGTEIMCGKPNQIALTLAYWRNPRVDPSQLSHLDPARDGCGLLWYAPLIPSKADKMLEFIDMVRRLGAKHNIEPMITFTHLSGHCTDSTIPIVFDKENPAAVSAAHACLDELVAEGLQKGFVPYRLNILQQQQLDATAVCWQTAGKIAHALDPNKVLSPGRYNPCLF